MKKYIIFVLFILTSNYVFGQATQISTLNISKGSSVDMYFNSETKLSDGITYTDWTRFRIRIDISTAAVPEPGVSWSLDVNRIGGDPIPGDVSPDLPADVLLIRAVYYGTDATLDTGIIPIVGVTNLFSVATAVDQNQIDDFIDITYYVGVTAQGCTTVLGEEADFYFTDLNYNLTVTW